MSADNCPSCGHRLAMHGPDGGCHAYPNGTDSRAFPGMQHVCDCRVNSREPIDDEEPPRGGGPTAAAAQCVHASAVDGPRIPVLNGSVATRVCVSCAHWVAVRLEGDAMHDWCSPDTLLSVATGPRITFRDLVKLAAREDAHFAQLEQLAQWQRHGLLGGIRRTAVGAVVGEPGKPDPSAAPGQDDASSVPRGRSDAWRSDMPARRPPVYRYVSKLIPSHAQEGPQLGQWLMAECKLVPGRRVHTVGMGAYSGHTVLFEDTETGGEQ